MIDKEIVALLQRRNEDAIPALEQQFGRRLQRLAQNILSSEEDVQECVNDTYLAVWNTIPPECPAILLPYVSRLCKNIAVSRLRHALARKRSGYQVALDELADVIGMDSLEEMVSARELGRAIDRFLDTLSRENRAIFLRRHWYGDSVAYIAEALSLSENTVSVRLHRIRSKLMYYLIKEGLYERETQ